MMEMNLSPLLKSKVGDALIYLTYLAFDISENDATKGYAKLTGISVQQAQTLINQLHRSYALIYNTRSYLNWRVAVRPEAFFELASSILSRHKDRLEWFRSKKVKQNEHAVFLWTVAEAYHYGKGDIKEALTASFPDRSFPENYIFDYVAPYAMSGRFDGYLTEIGIYNFNALISGLLVAALSSDKADVDFFDKLEQLVTLYSLEGEYNYDSQVDYLGDLNSCYRYFFDGTVSEPFGLNATYPYTVMMAIKALYEDRIEDSVKLFTEALKERNQTNEDKNLFRNGVMSFYLILAYKKLNTADTSKKVLQFLNKKPVQEDRELKPAAIIAKSVGEIETEAWLDSWIYSAWRYSGDAHVRHLASIVAGYFGRLSGDRAEGLVPVPDTMPNFALFRHELSPYVNLLQDEKDRLTRLFGGSPVLASIRRKERWETVLDDISKIIEASSGKRKSVSKDVTSERIAYYLDPKGERLEFRIQSRLKNGEWGVGKKAGKGDFFNANIPCMDAADRKIASTARDFFSGSTLAVEDALPYLIGSDRVYTATTYENVNVIEEKPFIVLKSVEGRFVPKTNVPADFRGIRYPVTVNCPSRTECTVIMLNDVQMKLLDSFMSLSTLPERSGELLEKLLPMVSQFIEVHSELLEGGSSLENLQGDPAVHIRILPDGDEYMLGISVLPLEGGQKRCFPGRGDKVIYDQRDSRRYQVTRSRTEEKKFWEEMVSFLQSVADSDGFDTEEFYVSPNELLQLVEWTAEKQDKYVLEWPEGKKIKVYPSSGSSASVGIKSNEGWFDIEGEIALRDAGSVKIFELLSLISTGNLVGNYVRLNEDTYLALTDSLRRQMKRLESISQLGKGGAKISKFSVGALAEIVKGKQDSIWTDDGFSDLVNKIEEASKLRPQVPLELNAVLRDYQYEGFKWMAQLDHWGAGACLADDMGLGKTVQTIAFLLYKASAGPSLVVAPASVVMNWVNELHKFAPSLNVKLLNHQTDRAQTLADASAGDVVITTYGLLPQEEEELTKISWNVVCLDEAHTIKNRQTKTSSAAMQLKASSRIILTGTPVQNYLGELWNLLQFLNPGLLGSFEQFSRKFINNEDADLSALRRVVQPFILRRTKNQVLDELPEKTEIVRSVALSDMEILAYENMRERVREELAAENKVTVNVLAEITRLRQAACSMALVDESWQGGESKIDYLMELLAEVVSGGNRVLVFSQFTSFLAKVTARMDAVGMESFYLDGSTPIKKREQMVNDFQKGVKQVFVVSLKAGGLGLNLTGANYVIHLDPWWNPAIEQQATDRAHRIGQKQPVTVYHLISSNTIEEKILRLHKVKRDLADTFLTGTEISHALTIDDLMELTKID